MNMCLRVAKLVCYLSARWRNEEVRDKDRRFEHDRVLLILNKAISIVIHSENAYFTNLLVMEPYRKGYSRGVGPSIALRSPFARADRKCRRAEENRRPQAAQSLANRRQVHSRVEDQRVHVPLDKTLPARRRHPR